MVQPTHQAGEITHAVVVGILEGFDVKLVDDGIAIPVGLGAIDDAIGIMLLGGRLFGHILLSHVWLRHGRPKDQGRGAPGG